MSRFLPPAWFLSAGVVVLLVAGFGYADKTRLHWYAPERSPVAVASAEDRDRVVGVIRRCLLGGQYAETGDGCNRADVRVLDDRLEITVRTRQGATYLVTMPVSSSAKVGDSWPP